MRLDKYKNLIMMMQNLKYKTIILVLAVALVSALAIDIWLVQKNKTVKISDELLSSQLSSYLVKPVLADEVYPLFFCPCCGQPLDKNNICCAMAQERIDYIDSLVAQGISQEEIILNYVKKYGLNSFTDEERQKEFKERLVAAAPDNRPIISLTPDFYDFADVSQKAGKVYTYFALKNEGQSDLVIDRLETSCGCTFAAIIYQGVESPYFTMAGHGYKNPEWSGVTIAPGREAKLKVMYDPDVHKDFRGTATREIYIFSNDPINFEKKVTVELNQVD